MPTDLGAADRRRLLSVIQPASCDPGGPAIRRALGGLVLLGLVVTLLAAAVTVAAEARDDIKETRRAVERCR